MASFSLRNIIVYRARGGYPKYKTPKLRQPIWGMECSQVFAGEENIHSMLGDGCVAAECDPSRVICVATERVAKTMCSENLFRDLDLDRHLLTL